MADTETDADKNRGALVTIDHQESVPPWLKVWVREEAGRQLQQLIERPNPMMLTSFDQVEGFAERAARTEMVPKAYRNKPDDIILAVMKGTELGLAPMQALESIAVINGRSTVWGDAVPGLCWASGKCQDIVEYFEGTEGTDNYTAVCVATRKGSEPKTARFSVADAKVARLHGQNVHATFPKRMLQWRARHFACHDAFPDVLKGLGTKELEEADSVPVPSWTMPRPDRAAFTRRPGKRTDGWDDTWFEGFVSKLIGETNAWRFMDVLLGGLKDAPTLRDVDEIDDLPIVTQTVGAAPAEARATIEGAFGEARKRFMKTEPPAATTATETGKPAAKAATKRKQAQTPPANDAQPAHGQSSGGTAASDADASQGDPGRTTAEEAQDRFEREQSGEAEFDHFLLDETGAPAVDDPYTDPLAWAKAFATFWERSANREALYQQNADAIADAGRISAMAQQVLAPIAEGETEAEEEAPEIPVIQLSLERGSKANWGQYIRDLIAAAASVTPDTYLDFIAAQQPVYVNAPASSRPPIAKLFIQLGERLDRVPPASLSDYIAGKTGASAGSATSAADKDESLVDRAIEDIGRMTNANDVRAHSNSPSILTPLRRFESEGKTALASRLRKAFTDRLAALDAKP